MGNASPSADYDDVAGLLSLSGPGFHLQIAITPQELRSLRGVGVASWDDRTSIKAGEALGHPVFWCVSTENPAAVVVLVGADDEVAELWLELPGAVVAGALPPI